MGVSVIVWFIVAAIAGTIEGVTTALVSVWFAVGAICAAIAAWAGISEVFQVLIFLLISAGLLLFTFPICKKFRLGIKKVPTNADRLIDKIGVITEDVDPVMGKGEVTVMGQKWSVNILNGENAKCGQEVIIRNISGAHLDAEIVKNDKEEKL